MCTVTSPSRAVPGHVHICGSDHATGDHICGDRSCRRWFGVAPTTTDVLDGIRATREADQKHRSDALLRGAS